MYTHAMAHLLDRPHSILGDPCDSCQIGGFPSGVVAPERFSFLPLWGMNPQVQPCALQCMYGKDQELLKEEGRQCEGRKANAILRMKPSLLGGTQHAADGDWK